MCRALRFYQAFSQILVHFIFKNPCKLILLLITPILLLNSQSYYHYTLSPRCSKCNPEKHSFMLSTDVFDPLCVRKTLPWFLWSEPVISALLILLVHSYQNWNIIAVISCDMTGADRSTRNGVKGSDLPQGKKGSLSNCPTCFN